MRKPSPAVLELLESCDPGGAHLALELRELVLSEAPEAEEVLYSVYAQVIVFKLPGCAGDAFSSVLAYSRHVNLGFYRGAQLPDPHRLIKGTGKKFRHLRFNSAEDLRPGQVRTYIRLAMEHAQSLPPPRAARKKPQGAKRKAARSHSRLSEQRFSF